MARSDVIVRTSTVFSIFELIKPVQSGIVDRFSNVAPEVESTMIAASQN